MEVRSLGASSARRVGFRLVTSTQRDLRRTGAEGRFRRDLLFRIQGIEIVLSPLRERRDDIPLLIEHFLKIEVGRFQAQVKLEPDAMKRLIEHEWPGNVQDLENEIRRLAILGSGRIRAADLALPSAPGLELGSVLGRELLRPGVFEKLSWPQVRGALERAYFERALETSGGSLKDLADRLGVHKRIKTQLPSWVNRCRILEQTSRLAGSSGEWRRARRHSSNMRRVLDTTTFTRAGSTVT